MDELGLFPLGIVLLPTERLPLHIFEERYKGSSAASASNTRPSSASSTRTTTVEGVGTRAHVVEVLTRFEGGGLSILVEGGERFRLTELTDGRSLNTGLVAPIEDADDPAETAAVDEALRLFEQAPWVTESEVDAPDRGDSQLSFALAGKSSFRATRSSPSSPRRRSACGSSSCRSCSRTLCSRRSGYGEQRNVPPRTARSTSGSPTRQGYDAFVAVTPETKLDANRLRADFAVFDELVNGRSVAFLDSAASTQKPRQVLDAMRDFYEHSYANVHRGVYRLAERATTGYETARGKVAGFVNAPSEREVIFTRSATEALNLVAYAWGLDNLGPGTSSSSPISSTLQLRAVAVRRRPDGRVVQGDPDRRVRRVTRSARSTRSSAPER